MTSLFTGRICLLTRLSTSNTLLHLSPGRLPLDQVRFAGHAKWQNIKSTKQATDIAKGQLISRYVQLVKKAIVMNGMKTDPKLNSKLAAVLSEASKFNVPKATLDRAITRATNMKLLSITVTIEGPGKSTIIARCETEAPSVLRREIKKAVRKLDAALLPENSLMSMFKSQGFIRATTTTHDGIEVTGDFAEEAAIVANAQDVYLEEHADAKDPSLSKLWVFTTDAETLNTCRGELEKLKMNVTSSDLDLVPYNAIDFGVEVHDQIMEIVKVLREMEQVVDVFHNAAPPAELADVSA